MWGKEYLSLTASLSFLAQAVGVAICLHGLFQEWLGSKMEFWVDGVIVNHKYDGSISLLLAFHALQADMLIC